MKKILALFMLATIVFSISAKNIQWSFKNFPDEVEIKKQSDCKKLVGLEYRATKGSADLSNLGINITNNREFTKLYGIALNLSNGAIASTDENKITYSINNPTLVDKDKKITYNPE